MPRQLFHGTHEHHVEHILREGLQSWHHREIDPKGPKKWMPKGLGLLGPGTYVSEDWRMSLWFGNHLLEVATLPGTRLLDLSPKGDPRVVESLRREFGHEVLERPVWETLPSNKRLTHREFVHLIRWHYHFSFGPLPAEEAPRRKRHRPIFGKLWPVVRRYGYHGFGHPTSDIGYVVDCFRLRVSRYLAAVPCHVDNVEELNVRSLEELTVRYPPPPHAIGPKPGRPAGN